MSANKQEIKKIVRALSSVLLMSFGAGPLSAQTNVVPDAVEFATLKAMFDNLGGANWTTKTNWPTAGNWPASATAAQMGTWTGIKVTNGDISSITFSANNLTGQLPSAIGDLKALKTLQLISDKLSGTLPASLNQLTELTYFYIGSHPSLSGDIPDLSALTKLVTLSFRNSPGLTQGQTPVWITNLINLTYLDLNGTKRNGGIPAAIGNLANLTQLDLSGNQLIGTIPPSIGNLTKLTQLYLNSNQLEGTIPDTFGNLTKLTHLYLGNNKLTGAIPASLGNLVNLTHLALEWNQLSGVLPLELGNLTKLIQLYLHKNQLQGIPPSIGNLTQLTHLYLQFNKLTGGIPSSLGNLVNLTQLVLADNQLEGDIPPSIGNLTQLTNLNLYSNKLTGEVPSSLGNLTNLAFLQLSSNQLTGELPASLGNLTKLSYFHAGGNQLAGTLPTTFANWQQIYSLDISSCRFSGVLDNNLFSTWGKLGVLNIMGNNFTGAFPSSISACPLLASLNASRSKFTSVPASILSLPVVTVVNFDNNELTSLPNFATHVNKANLTLTVSNNRLDFTHLEPLVGAGIKTVSTLVQKPINDVATLSLTTGSDLTMTARAKGDFTNNLKWEKLQANGVTWQDISSANTDGATTSTYRIANASMAAEGTYRWSATSTKATGVTIISEPMVVKTTERFTLDNLAFQYKYDGRRRMTAKKVPGAEWVYMVYDNRDRLVLTQDGEQRKANRWTFTKYDALNRPVMTGIYTHATPVDQGTMQGVVDTYYNQTPFPTTKAWFETYSTAVNNVLLYDNKSFPVASEASALTVTYYDNYLFKPSLGEDYQYVPTDVPGQTVNGATYSQPYSENLRVVGLVTGTRAKMLSTGLVAGAGWLNNVTYYDDKYRVIQTIADNHLGGKERTTNLVDFVGKVLHTKTTHQGGAIQWKDALNVVIGSNSVAGTNPSSTWGTSGAASKQRLAANTDGWLEVTVSELNTHRMIGFSESNMDANYTSIDYALYLAHSSFQVYEKGVYRNISVPMAKGDILRLERTGSVIRYLRNGTLVYTSTTPSSSALLIDLSIHTPGATLTNIRTSFGQPEPAQTLARSFTYDHAGRLLKTFHSVNGATPVLLVQNEYNELGQLVDKKLHSTDNGTTSKQSVDYRYNIRGWLTRMNNSDVKQASNLAEDGSNVMPDLFGMNLHYNDLEAGLTTAGDEQYNGNISAISYSTNQSLGAIKKNGYRFGYDSMNRLLSATHKQRSVEWDASDSFHEDNLKYDLNGNIQKLNRKGANGSNMDVLDYTYGTGSAAGNQLQTVSDGGELTAGFIDGNIGSTDYAYDLNGNMTVDRNKGVTAITYNHLNLPDKVTKSLPDRQVRAIM